MAPERSNPVAQRGAVSRLRATPFANLSVRTVGYKPQRSLMACQDSADWRAYPVGGTLSVTSAEP